MFNIEKQTNILHVESLYISKERVNDIHSLNKGPSISNLVLTSWISYKDKYHYSP